DCLLGRSPPTRQQVEQLATADDLAHGRLGERPERRVAVGQREDEAFGGTGIGTIDAIFERGRDLDIAAVPGDQEPLILDGIAARPPVAGLPALAIRLGSARGPEADLEAPGPVGSEDRDPLNRIRPAEMKPRPERARMPAEPTQHA